MVSRGRRRGPGRARRAGGQAAVFLLLLLSVLVFLLLFLVDLHRIIQRKDQAQNAGDAAALAAARWQGSTLNLIGELNIMHALALCAPHPDLAAARAVTNMQARLCFTGPLAGLLAAQAAAKNNHAYSNEEMTGLLNEHARTIRGDYSQTFENGEMAFREPWPGAWREYADILDRIAASGIAAGPDNVREYQLAAGHILLAKDFYEAVESRDWCWFFFHAFGLLKSYSSRRDWPPLPRPERDDYANSEIFGLGLRSVTAPLKQILPAETLARRAADAGFPELTARRLAAPYSDMTAERLRAPDAMSVNETWFFYRPGEWGPWRLMARDGEDGPFPVLGPVKPHYDTAGADAVLRVYARVDRIMPGAGGASRGSVTWSAAAKPFGYLETDDGKAPVTAAAFFVLPAFRNVRLIPVDAASGAQNFSADAEWVAHIRRHLRVYLENGTLSPRCRYCRALAQWDRAPFRESGIDWLREFSGTCRRPRPGHGHGGGTRRGH